MRGAALVWYNKLIAVGEAKGKVLGIAEGEAKGKVLGIAEGEARGEARGKADSIIAILTKRYSAVPNAIASRIRDIHDLTSLDSLLIDAMECASLEEFDRCL